MRLLAITCFLILGSAGFSQQISSMDFVKVKNNHFEETEFYYDNNWKKLREIALQRGIIHSYELKKVKSGTEEKQFDFILITTYQDQAQYDASEEEFDKIIAEVRKTNDGPKLLNQIKPSDFREILYNQITLTIARGN